MATIAEQEKLKNLELEKKQQAGNQSGPTADLGSTPERVRELQKALREKERWSIKKLKYWKTFFSLKKYKNSDNLWYVFHSVIEQLQVTLKDQDAMIGELRRNDPDQPTGEQMTQLNSLIGQKDSQLQVILLVL